MAFDQGLAERIRQIVDERQGISEKAMFGGVAFLHEGRIFVGIVKDDLMVRVGPDAHEAALARRHVRPMDFSGRPMQGYVYVAPAGTEDDAALTGWIDLALAHVVTLPAKTGKATAGQRRPAGPKGATSKRASGKRSR